MRASSVFRRSSGGRAAVAVALAVALGGAAGGGGGSKQADTRAAPAPTTMTTAPAPTPTSAAAESSTTATSHPSTSKTTAKPAAASPTTASTGSTTGSGPQTAPHATVFVVAAPTDPAELDRLADQLAADETALRDPATPEADLPALARRQQAAYRALYAYNHSDHYVKAVTIYAQQIEANQRAYLAYHAWQVYYITPRGDLWLEEGYGT